MKKIFFTVFVHIVLLLSVTNGQVIIDTISLVCYENVNTEFCFNNSKLMAGNSVSDRYLVYYNLDTVFLNVYQSGIWTRKIAYTGSQIKSSTMAFNNDTIWLCWKEGVVLAQIKAMFSTDGGNTWTVIPPVSPVGNVAAPSVYASSNGKIHFVWHTSTSTDTRVFHRVFYNGSYLTSASSLSNPTAHGMWPSVIAIGDTVLCAWKEEPLPSQVWFRSSFDGGVSWNTLSTTPTTTLLALTKDPNLAYAYDSVTGTHYIYLAYDGQNKIYMQRSTDFGNSWTLPDTVSSIDKLSQFAHIECNNNGFVGITYEQRPLGTSLFDDIHKDVGFTYSTDWGNTGSFSVDSLAYTHNGFGSVFSAINKIDENNFYLVWLTRDTVTNKALVLERHIHFNSSTGITFLQDTNIHVSPNPFNEQINIRNDKSELSEVILYDIASRKIIQQKFIRSLSLYTEQLEGGIYLYEVRCGSKLCRKGKLVKN